MKISIGIIGLLINLQVYAQSDRLVGKEDDIIDTVKFDNEHYIRFYRRESIIPVNLDFDNYTDTIVWFNFMLQSVERQVAFFDYEQKIQIKNKQGTIVAKGDWDFIAQKFLSISTSLSHKNRDYLTLQLDNRTTALILSHRLTGSDTDAYTIITIDSLTKPKVVFDSEFILTMIEDLDNDGFRELIGKHPNQAIPEYSINYVPFMVFKYSDSLYMDNKLTYNYNLPYKKYREFPETSITILTEESLKGIAKSKLRLMRNEIFADYGHIFTSPDLNTHFRKKMWYKPRPNAHFLLTEWEKQNIELIKLMESKL